MHEAALAESILNIVLNKLHTTANAECARAVKVSVGEFRNVDCESLQFAFDNIKSLVAGCETCELKLQVIPAQALCKENRHNFRADFNHNFRCPTCGSGIGTLVSGEEFAVTGFILQTI